MPGRDLDLLHQVAVTAGNIAKRHFKNEPEVWDKDENQGPVTEADLEINRMLHAELLSARPDFGWLSEESEDNTDRLNKTHVFIIDPIDGTRSFIKGHTTFAHSLAIAKDGEIVAAVVHLPMLDLMFGARTGNGAWLNGKAITHSNRAVLPGAGILATKPTLDAALWPGGVPDVKHHFRSSLAYRMCLVAQGRFDGMVTLRDAWEWDIAAGDLICREAGAPVTDKNGKALRFNNPHPQTAGVLAATPVVHAGLLAHLQPLPDQG